MNDKTSHPKIDPGTIGGGVAAGGIGVLLVQLANNLPPSSKYKSWLIIIAPFLSVSISYAWIWIKNNLEKKKLKKQIEIGREEMIQLVEKPTTPKAVRKVIMDHLKEGEKIIGEVYVENIKRHQQAN